MENLNTKYRVVVPVYLAIDVDANNGPATVEVIKRVMLDAFSIDQPGDPLMNTKIEFAHSNFFTVDTKANVRGAELIEDVEIEVFEL